MKENKNQVRAKGNIYAGKDSLSGEPLYQIDNYSHGQMGPRSSEQFLRQSLQHYYVLGKSLWSEAEMEDLVNTMLLYSIWCDGGGKGFGSGFKSLLCSQLFDHGKITSGLCPISKMEGITVECKPLAQSLP